MVEEQRIEAALHYPVTRIRSQHSLSLTNLFQIVTGCGMFFACMRISPAAAICLTVLITPAIIRTGLISQSHRESRLAFGLQRRAHFFLKSLGVVSLTYMLAATVFSLVSLAFGLICILITSVTLSNVDLVRDIGFIGVLGGTIWGAAAAIMSVSWTHRLWQLPAVD